MGEQGTISIESARTATSAASNRSPEKTVSPSQALKKLDQKGIERFEALRFLVIVYGRDLKLSKAAYFSRLMELFELEALALVQYLNKGELAERNRKVFRSKIVSLWSSLEKHKDQQVDWGFVSEKLGQNSLIPVLLLG